VDPDQSKAHPKPKSADLPEEHR
jgi:hypothetical protein